MRDVRLYKVFLASPGGLENYRTIFRRIVLEHNDKHGLGKDYIYWPIGWKENVAGGVGRGQALINRELDSCDYFVLVVADRWGHPTGGRSARGHVYSSGIDEEYSRAQELLISAGDSMKNILVLFKDIPSSNFAASDEYDRVASFKQALSAHGNILYKTFHDEGSFGFELESALLKWANDGHLKVDLSINAAGLPPDRFQHPWLGGGMLRRQWPGLSEKELEQLTTLSIEIGKADITDAIRKVRLLEVASSLKGAELARLYCMFGKFDLAEETQRKVLEEVHGNGEEKHVAILQALGADILMARRDLDGAIVQYKELCDSWSHDRLFLADLFCRIGIAYRKKADFEEVGWLITHDKRTGVERSEHWAEALRAYRRSEALFYGRWEGNDQRSLLFSIMYGISHSLAGQRDYRGADSMLTRILEREIYDGDNTQQHLRVLRSIIWVTILDDSSRQDYSSRIQGSLNKSIQLAGHLHNVYEEIMLLEAQAKMLIDVRVEGVINYSKAGDKYREAKEIAQRAGFRLRVKIIDAYLRNISDQRDFDAEN